ncbi:MAG TPA: aspartyl/asparaginyl beta-hydroxylase domain-containing protein [Pseudomonadales bacterium]|nr:aspartyl/asparaginyl beta-hydroxylase domain-containing protein [Pseudomonadales bacterium]
MHRGLDAEEGGRLAVAVDAYAQAVRLAPGEPVPYLYLAFALAESGREDAAARVASLGHDVDPRLLNAWRSAGSRAPIALRSRRVDALLRASLSALHADSVARAEAELDCPLPRLRAGIWCQTHDRAFDYGVADQRPWILYLPDLAPVRWFDTGTLPWAGALEAQWQTLRDEALAVLDACADARRPYVDAEEDPGAAFAPLRGSSAWDSLHLYRAGVAADEAVRTAMPRIHAAVEASDCVRMNDVPMEAFLSVLAPATRIPPHFGLANTRMTVHLPLAVPDACGLRVGDELRTPEPGKLLAFDDSFRHEAWNDGDAPRVHLILEAWRPDLAPEEKLGLARIVDARDAWNRSRTLPDTESLAS